jgi:hypothetical protein
MIALCDPVFVSEAISVHRNSKPFYTGVYDYEVMRVRHARKV